MVVVMGIHCCVLIPFETILITHLCIIKSQCYPLEWPLPMSQCLRLSFFLIISLFLTIFTLFMILNFSLLRLIKSRFGIKCLCQDSMYLSNQESCITFLLIFSIMKLIFQNLLLTFLQQYLLLWVLIFLQKDTLRMICQFQLHKCTVKV